MKDPPKSHAVVCRPESGEGKLDARGGRGNSRCKRNSLSHLEGLDIHDLYQEHISRLGAIYVEWAGEVMDLGQVDIEDVVCAIIVANLATRPTRCIS